MRKTTDAMAIVCALFVSAGTLLANGDGSNVRGAAMGRTAVAASRGLDAVGINPANLGIDDGNTVGFGLVRFGGTIGSDFLTYGLYNKFFTGVDSDSGRIGRYLTTGDKQEILNAFDGGIGEIGAGVEVRPFSLAIRMGRIGTVAFTVTEHIGGLVRIPKEYVQFLLYGNTPGSVYNFSGTNGSAEWTREYAISYGREIPSFWLFNACYAGAAVKLVHGYAHMDVQRFNTMLSTGMNGVMDGQLDVLARFSRVDMMKDGGGDFTPFPAPAGTGIAFDLGFTGVLNDFITAGISVTDIGSLRWTRNVEEAYSQAHIVVDNPTDQGQRDSIDNAVQGDTRDGSAFTTNLPTIVRVGVSIELHEFRPIKSFLLGEMTVAADYSQCLEPAPGIAAGGRFSLGLEYRPIRQIPIRLGMSAGNMEGFAFAMGLGFHLGFFELDLASNNMGWLFSNDSFSRASVYAGMRLVF